MVSAVENNGEDDIVWQQTSDGRRAPGDQFAAVADHQFFGHIGRTANRTMTAHVCQVVFVQIEAKLLEKLNPGSTPEFPPYSRGRSKSANGR